MNKIGYRENSIEETTNRILDEVVDFHLTIPNMSIRELMKRDIKTLLTYVKKFDKKN